MKMVFPQIDPPQGKSAAGLIGPSEGQEARCSQQNTGTHRKTTSPAGAQANNARNKHEKQIKTVPHGPFDGIITDKPNFPLSEIIGLKRCDFSADFYAYARLNGRTGVIVRDLIEDILKNSMPMDDFLPEQPEAEGLNAKVERKESKGKGKAKQEHVPRVAAAQGAAAAADSDRAAETEVIIQTFEQVCEELKTCLVGMDAGQDTESGRQKTRVCLDTMKAVSERARELSQRSLMQHAAAAVASSSLSSSSSTPSAIDPKTHCVVPRPSPWNGKPCGRRLPCVAHSDGREIKKQPPGKPTAKDLSKSGPVQAFRSLKTSRADARPQRRPILVNLRQRERRSKGRTHRIRSGRWLSAFLPTAMATRDYRTRRRPRRRWITTRSPVRTGNNLRRCLVTVAPQIHRESWIACKEILGAFWGGAFREALSRAAHSRYPFCFSKDFCPTDGTGFQV